MTTSIYTDNEKSSDLFNLPDDKAQLQAKKQQSSPMSDSVIEASKIFNYLASGAFYSFIKGLYTPLPQNVLPTGEALPEGLDEAAKRNIVRKSFAIRMGKDVGVWVGCMFVEDIIFRTLKSFRGKEDSFNNAVSAGVAGAALGAFWASPVNPARVLLFAVVGTGAGIFDFHSKKSLKEYLLTQQQQLEREVLKTPEDQVRSVLDEGFLRYLVLSKQQQATASQLGLDRQMGLDKPKYPVPERKQVSLLPPAAEMARRNEMSTPDPLYNSGQQSRDYSQHQSSGGYSDLGGYNETDVLTINEESDMDASHSASERQFSYGTKGAYEDDD